MTRSAIRTAAVLLAAAIGILIYLVTITCACAEEATRYWAVTGVPAGDVLNLRDVPHGDSRKLAGIPPGAAGLKNLGCLKPEPSLERWASMTPAERENAKLEWCRIEYQGRQGWVAARFLKPDPR
jgi:hypothetical protein